VAPETPDFPAISREGTKLRSRLAEEVTVVGVSKSKLQQRSQRELRRVSRRPFLLRRRQCPLFVSQCQILTVTGVGDLSLFSSKFDFLRAFSLVLYFGSFISPINEFMSSREKISCSRFSPIWLVVSILNTFWSLMEVRVYNLFWER